MSEQNSPPPPEPTPPTQPPPYGVPEPYAYQPPAQYGYPPPVQPPAYATYGPPMAVPPHLLASPWLRLGGALLSAVLAVLTLGIGYLIWALIVWKNSTTPAKQLLGMRIVDSRTGQPLTYGRMVLRQVVFAVIIGLGSSLTLGILGLVDALMVFGDTRQRLLDKMSSTLVVRV